MAKFTIKDYDNLMEEVRQKHRKPDLIQRLKETAKRRRLPRLPRI